MDQENHAIVRFRIAQMHDIEALADLRWKLCTEDDDALQHGPLKKSAFIEAFCSQLSHAKRLDEITHFVAETQTADKIVSVMSIVKVQGLPCPDNLDGAWGYLTNVYTLPECRNQGIGSRLLAEVRRWAKEQRLELLIVWPSDRSYPFYERSGFLREPDPLVLKMATDR